MSTTEQHHEFGEDPPQTIPHNNQVGDEPPSNVKVTHDYSMAMHGSHSGPEPDQYREFTDEEGSDWSQESYVEDTIRLIDDHEYAGGGLETCSLAEAQQLRKQLREVGPEEFIRRTLESGQYTVRRLCTAFGAVLSEALAEAEDEVLITLLGALMNRELSKRRRIDGCTSIDDAANLLRESRNIIVLTGAGISTNLGIPDFRSEGTGLYARLAHLGLTDPQEVFSIELFSDDPTIFYSIARDIVPASKRFSPTHAFIRLLQDKNKLLTNFTQNIDNLEAAAGIVPEKLIQCHGSFASATCRQCGFKCPGDQIMDDLKAGKVAYCPACIRRIRQLGALGLKRKHSSSSTTSNKKRRKDFDQSSDSEEEDDDMDVPGVMKPDITFFGEDLPKTFHDRLIDHDRDRVDLVIVIGTSLKVAPVADIPDFLPPNVPHIYISRDPVKHIEFDVELLGDCDQIVTELCRRAGWDLQHDMVPQGQILDAILYEEHSRTRWKMIPREGTDAVKPEALDSGTLGHGIALSPTREHPHDQARPVGTDIETAGFASGDTGPPNTANEKALGTELPERSKEPPSPRAERDSLGNPPTSIPLGIHPTIETETRPKSPLLPDLATDPSLNRENATGQS